MSTRPHYLDVLHLTASDLQRILADLRGAAGGGGQHKEKRSEARHACQGHSAVLIEIHYPGRHVGTYRAVYWNISSAGLGFLHGKFVYPGSTARVTLKGIDNRIIGVDGTIIRCRHLEGRVHEVGMRFNEPIDLHEVILDDDIAALHQHPTGDDPDPDQDPAQSSAAPGDAATSDPASATEETTAQPAADAPATAGADPPAPR